MALRSVWREWGRFLQDIQTSRQICCSINILLKSHLTRSPGLATRCKRIPSSAYTDSNAGPGPPLAHWDSQMRRATNTINHHALVKFLLLLGAATSHHAVRRLQLHQIRVLRGTKQGLNTQRLNKGELWPECMIFINTIDPHTHCYLSNKIHEHCSKMLKHCPASVYRIQEQLNEPIQQNCPGTDFQNSFYQLCSEMVGNSSHFHSIVSK